MIDPGPAASVRTRRPAPSSPNDAGYPTEIALLDRAGDIVWVNEAWLEFARENDGDPATTGVGASYLDACAAGGDDPGAKAVAEAVRAALRGELPAPATVSIPCGSATEARWFDVLISERRDDDGAPVGAVLCLLRRAAGPCAQLELPVRREVEPLVDYAEVVRHAPEGIMFVDAAGKPYVANPAACVLLGRTESELLALDPRDLVDPGDRHRWVAAHAALVETGRFWGEVWVLRSDGRSCPVEVSAWRWSPGGGDGFAMIVRDATELAERRGPEVAREALEALRLERARIAEAVHGSVLQDLFAIALTLSRIDDPRSLYVDQAADLVRRTMVDLRAILAPPAPPGACSGPGADGP